MIWMEMARDDMHGGNGWEFGTCLWSPAKKEDGSKWPYWSLLLEVQAGDQVLHLRGVKPKAVLAGISIADADGYSTSRRPPEPGARWAFAKQFNRVPLRDYAPFAAPPPLSALFKSRDSALRNLVKQNRGRSKGSRKLIFCITQAGHLQCQNGAYLSVVDREMANVLLDHDLPDLTRSNHPASVATGQQMRYCLGRIGQDDFSDMVRENYGRQCCYPGCQVAEEPLLVGAHIARWADEPDLRGLVSNGLCLCLMHDKAFEIGLFTIDDHYRIYVNKGKLNESPWARVKLLHHDGEKIRHGKILPSIDSLKSHWGRLHLTPG